MSFSAEWLALREPADAAARSSLLARASGASREVGALRVVDLAAGTGANLRYLIEQLPPRQHWLLVDHDPTLLAQVPGRMRAWGETHGYRVALSAEAVLLERGDVACEVRTRLANLAALDDREIFEGCGLVTASALLDLVSERWVHALADACHRHRAAALLALTYDGRIAWEPGEPEDATIRELVNRHQRSDKGFGPALGPEAAACAEECFGRLGYTVRREPSDWVLATDASELQRELLEGWAQAAMAIAPGEATPIHAWLMRRLAHVRAGRSRITVGHQDLAAWLAR